MANGKAHQVAGTVAGVGTAIIRRRKTDSMPKVVAESIGGLIGGRIGAKIPDWLEPATSPNHRGFMHSITVAGGVATVMHRACSSWEAEARAHADRFETERLATENPLMKFLYLIAEYLCRVGAAIPAGMFAGYFSHLALDMPTPKSIPLLLPGF